MANIKPATKPLKSHKGSNRFELKPDGTKNRKVNPKRTERN